MRSAISCFVNFDEIMFYTWSRTVYSFSPPSRLLVIENKKRFASLFIRVCNRPCPCYQL